MRTTFVRIVRFLRWSFVSAVAFGTSTAGLIACASSGNDDVGVVDSGTSRDARASDGPVLKLGADASGEAASGFGCSADLQQVIGAGGKVIETCPPDEGCAAGKCIPACQAAAANKGTIGCDFMQATPSFYTELLPPCWAVFIANNWGKAATLTVSWNGTDYDVTKFGRIPVAGEKETDWATVPATGIPVGQVAILFISSDPMATNLAGPTVRPVADAIDDPRATTRVAMATALRTRAKRLPAGRHRQVRAEPSLNRLGRPARSRRVRISASLDFAATRRRSGSDVAPAAASCTPIFPAGSKGDKPPDSRDHGPAGDPG